MFGRLQLIADLALGWFIYTKEGRNTAKKIIKQLNNDLKLTQENSNGKQENLKGNIPSTSRHSL
jgi:hypothetical protein